MQFSIFNSCLFVYQDSYFITHFKPLTIINLIPNLSYYKQILDQFIYQGQHQQSTFSDHWSRSILYPQVVLHLEDGILYLRIRSYLLECWQFWFSVRKDKYFLSMKGQKVQLALQWQNAITIFYILKSTLLYMIFSAQIKYLYGISNQSIKITMINELLYQIKMKLNYKICNFNIQMKKSLVIFSILFLVFNSEPQPQLKGNFYLSTPEIRHKYSIVTQKMNEQKQKQRMKYFMEKQPNTTSPTAPTPGSQTTQSQRTQAFQMGQQKPISDFNRRVPQPITINLPSRSKPIQVAKKPIIPQKKIQFQDKITQVKLKQKKNYKIYNINDQSVLDLDGNIASLQLLQTRIRKSTQNFFDTLAQTIKIKPKISEQKINIKNIIQQRRQAKPKQTKQNNLKSQGSNSIKIQQQNQTHSWIVVGIFLFSALLILFGYTPEDRKDGMSLNSRDDQQFNLK